MYYLLGEKMKKMSFVALVFAGACDPVFAESVDENHPLEHVLVSLPFQRIEAETALPITTIHGDALRNTAVATLGDTLDNNPGLANASFGPGVGQPVIRGQQGARVSVLQNSLLVGDASSLSADHGVAVEPILADSIEVLRGPSTLLYGSGAIGGVVNVIDNRIPLKQEPNQATAEVRHASVDDGVNGVFRLDGSHQQFAFHFDALVRRTNDLEIPGYAMLDAEEEHEEEHEEELEGEHEDDAFGFIPNTDSSMEAFTLGGSYFLANGLVGLAYSDIQNTYGVPAGSHVHEELEDEIAEEEDHAEEDVRIDMQKQRTDFRLSLNDVSAWLDSIDWKASYSEYQHIELEGDVAGTQFNNRLWQNRVQLVHRPVGSVHGVLGLQQSSSDFSAVGDERFIPPSQTNQLGVFLVENMHTDNATIEVGLRWDGVDLAAESQVLPNISYDAISAGASILWHFSSTLHLGVSYSYAERAPVVEELLSNVDADDTYVVHAATGVIEVGNTDLDVERSNNVDVSFSWEYPSAEGFITLFNNDFSDYIYLQNNDEMQDDVAIYRYQQSRARFHGVEVENQFQLTSNVSWRLFADRILGQFQNDDYVPRMPPARVGSELTFNVNAWQIHFSMLRASAQKRLASYETPTDGWTRFDASVNYMLPMKENEALLFFRLKNLTNEDIRNSVSFLKEVAPEAGRSIEVGARIIF